jgi:hypothetical protein
MAMTITAMYVPCEVIAERCLQEIDTNSDAGMANTTTSWLRVETTAASKWTRARVGQARDGHLQQFFRGPGDVQCGPDPRARLARQREPLPGSASISNTARLRWPSQDCTVI